MRCPWVSVDGRGNALATWYQQLEAHILTFSSRYTTADGSAEETRIDGVIVSNMLSYAPAPVDVGNDAGNAIARWRQPSSSLYTFWSNAFE